LDQEINDIFIFVHVQTKIKYFLIVNMLSVGNNPNNLDT